MTDVQPGDRFCRACGAALSVLAQCPHGCDVVPEKPDLKLVVDVDEELLESDRDEDTEGRGW